MLRAHQQRHQHTERVTKYFLRKAAETGGPSCSSYRRAWHWVLTAASFRVVLSDKTAVINSHAVRGVRILLPVSQIGPAQDWSWLCRVDLKQLYIHLPARQTPALICNLLFIMKRHRLGEEDNLVVLFVFFLSPSKPPTTILLLSRGYCVEKQMEWLPFVVRRGSVETGGGGFSLQNLNANLAIQCTQATAASCIVQILMHGRDQIKIYQLRVRIHLQIYFHRMKNWKGKGERLFPSLVLICSVVLSCFSHRLKPNVKS